MVENLHYFRRPEVLGTRRVSARLVTKMLNSHKKENRKSVTLTIAYNDIQHTTTGVCRGNKSSVFEVALIKWVKTQKTSTLFNIKNVAPTMSQHVHKVDP